MYPNLRRHMRMLVFLALSIGGAVLNPVMGWGAPDAPLISKDELKAALGSTQLTIIDVRTPKDWDSSAKKIKGAIRQDSGKVEVWAKTYKPDQEIVLYCA